MCVSMYIYVCVYSYEWMHVCLCMFVYMHECVSVNKYVHMCESVVYVLGDSRSLDAGKGILR